MALISNFVIISLFFSLVYFIGLLTFITEHEENKCEMTFMFEYPQFVKISFSGGEKYPRYGLYAYGEGKFTERARAMKFDGIPVLFVPGNAGSHKQVRSLASVALRKALNSRSRYHFDFFTVDLNDELSGLNGALLNEQTSFINESIHKILTLYTSRTNQPKSVILIGHSMGGVISQGLLAGSDIQNVELLITLGSPHRKPSICLDWHMAKYYEELHRNVALKGMNQTFITIGGGNSDRLVNSWLTNANLSSLNVISTTVPGVWLSMDHACLMWCKQLVLAIIRSLFDAVDINTQQLSADHNFRLAAFKHHLLHNSGTSFQQASKYRTLTQLYPRGEWVEDIRRQYTIRVPKTKNQVHYYMVRLLNDPQYQAIFMQATNIFSTDWIYVCSAHYIQGQSRICDEASHLSHRSEITPFIKNKRRAFYMDLFRLKKRYPDYTHVVFMIPPSPEPVILNFDIHNPKERLISVDLPSWYSLSRKTIIKQTTPEALRYVIELPGLQHIVQQYLLYLEPISCATTSHYATAKLYLPWTHHDSYSFVTEGIKKPLLLRLHNSKPSNNVNSTAKIILTLDPTCQYSVSIRSSIIGMLSQLTRYYSPLLVANIAAVILMAFYSQLIHLDQEGRCLNFQAALSISTKPYYLVTAAKLISRTLSFGRLSDIFPTPDGQQLLNENLEFLILPLLLYVTAVGLTYLISVGLWSALILSESTIHKVVARCVTRTLGGAVKWSDWLLNALHKVPCVVAITLFSLGLSTCGAMALSLGVVYYFLKLTQLCQEFLEGLVFRYIKKIIFKFIGLFKRKKSKDVTEQNNTQTQTNENIKHSDVEQIKNKSEEQKTESQNVIETKEGTSKEIEQNDSQSTTGKEVEGINKENENVGSGDNLENDIRLRKMQVERVEENKEESTSENRNEAQENRDAEKNKHHDGIHFHFTLFLIWLFITIINLPSVLTWARNFQYNRTLRPDPSNIPGIALSLCAIFLWQMDIPKPNKLYYKEIGMFLYAMAVFCLVYTPVSIYRLPYIFTVIIIVVTLHQLFGPEQEEEEEEVEDILNVEQDPIEQIADIKTKLE